MVMATQQNYQNYIPAPQAQSYPVQGVSNVASVSSVQNNVSQPQNYTALQGQTYPNNGYVPRYAPMVHQGQMYSVPVANTLQPYPQNSNNYNTQYPNQAQQQSGQPNGCPNKGGSVGTVNISINGVNPPGQQPTPQIPQIPAYYPVPYYVPYPVPQKTTETTNNTTNTQTSLPASPVQPAQSAPAKQEPIAASKVDGKAEAGKPKQPVVELTDDYIKNLEYDLNSDNDNVRKHAVTELLKRFKEDETRKDDVRLTALLNQALQDDSRVIALTAMQILQSGYANGNETTVNRLNDIRNKNDEIAKNHKFGNAETAESILTLMSGKNPSLFTNNASPIRSNQ
jgi:hypothetical protein